MRSVSSNRVGFLVDRMISHKNWIMFLLGPFTPTPRRIQISLHTPGQST